MLFHFIYHALILWFTSSSSSLHLYEVLIQRYQKGSSSSRHIKILNLISTFFGFSACFLLKVLLAGFAWYSYWFLLKRYMSQTYKGLKLEFPIVRYLQYMPLPKHCFQLRCGFYGDVLCFLHNSFERMDNLCHDCSFTRSLWCRIAGVGFLIENLMIKHETYMGEGEAKRQGSRFLILKVSWAVQM